MKELYTVFFLAANSWLDFRSREISLVLAGIYGISGIMYSIFTGRPIGDILIPAGIGMMFLAAGFLSRGTVGVGDGWILAAYRNLCSDALYGSVFCGRMVRCSSCSVWKEQKNRDTAGSVSAGRIYRSCAAMKREYLRKGSFTIEAACVMSLVLLVLMGVLYLTFFVHNRAWLTAAACESALTGSMEGIRKDGQAEQAAESRCRELGNVGFFGAENLTGQVQGGKKIKVTYTADTISGFGGLKWELMAEGSSLIIRPAAWIRKIKAASEVIEEMGE